MELIVYVMLSCMRPTIAPSVEVCPVIHIYTKQADCDADAARLARLNKNRFEYRCSDAIKVKSERMPEAWTGGTRK